MQLEKTNAEPGHEAFQKTNVREVMTRIFPNHKPSFETVADLLRRKIVIDDFFKEYERCNPLSVGKKYGVVCHSMLIATLTSDGEDSSDKKGLKNYVWSGNC